MDYITDPEWINILNNKYLTDVLKQPNTIDEKLIFAPMILTNLKDIKIIILSEYPEKNTNGLAYATLNTEPTIELKNIYNSLGVYKTNHTLTSWAKQGVLLLNATLTVRAHEAGSHQKKGWEKFTDAVIANISENTENVVFLLWGGYAKKKGAKIDKDKHLVLTSGHPSPLSANRGYWFGNKHFSKTNSILKSNAIKW